MLPRLHLLRQGCGRSKKTVKTRSPYGTCGTDPEQTDRQTDPLRPTQHGRGADPGQPPPLPPPHPPRIPARHRFLPGVPPAATPAPTLLRQTSTAGSRRRTVALPSSTNRVKNRSMFSCTYGAHRALSSRGGTRGPISAPGPGLPPLPLPSAAIPTL